MSKSTFFTGQPIFTQLLQLIPKTEVRQVVRKHSSDRYCKKFYTYDHLVTMLFCALHQCTSLREVTTGMQALGERLRHLGLVHTPRRSTFADSNCNRSSQVFEDLFHALVRHFYKTLPDSRSKNELRKRFIIDSTTFTLFNNVMKGAGTYGLNGKKKGGAKAHVVLDANEDVPIFVRITEARMSDKSFLNHIRISPNSIVVMDKGYNQYKTFAEWTSHNIRWYTRINKAAVYQVVETLVVSDHQRVLGVMKDQLIKLGNPETQKKNPLQEARLVHFKDALTNKVFQFVCNDFMSSPHEIAEMYRKRWQIELFFKRLKQNFPLKYFLGDSENAIRIQIWCSLIADLLMKVIMDKVAKGKKWSYANLCGIVRLHLGTYINLFAFLKNPEKALINYKPPNLTWQTKLF
jgi:hypothetical protein